MGHRSAHRFVSSYFRGGGCGWWEVPLLHWSLSSIPHRFIRHVRKEQSNAPDSPEHLAALRSAFRLFVRLFVCLLVCLFFCAFVWYFNRNLAPVTVAISDCAEMLHIESVSSLGYQRPIFCSGTFFECLSLWEVSFFSLHILNILLTALLLVLSGTWCNQLD